MFMAGAFSLSFVVSMCRLFQMLFRSFDLFGYCDGLRVVWCKFISHLDGCNGQFFNLVFAVASFLAARCGWGSLFYVGLA